MQPRRCRVFLSGTYRPELTVIVGDLSQCVRCLKPNRNWQASGNSQMNYPPVSLPSKSFSSTQSPGKHVDYYMGYRGIDRKIRATMLRC